MKKNILFLATLSIFLLVFEILFFLLGDNSTRTTSLWISYGFIHFSYLIFVLSVFVNKGGPGDNGYDVSTVYVTWKYFVLEFIVGLIFIWINSESIGWALTVQLLLAAISIVIWFVNLMANEHTDNSLRVQEKEFAYIQTCSLKLKMISNNLSDIDAKKFVEKCYDAVCSSPSRSNANLAMIEKVILDSIDELEEAVYTNNIDLIKDKSNKILRLIAERNLKLKFK